MLASPQVSSQCWTGLLESHYHIFQREFELLE